MKARALAGEGPSQIEGIQRVVADHYGVTHNELTSERRSRYVARPRQVAMYLAKTETTRSLTEIGREFGRDHTTVLYAQRKIDVLVKTDREVADAIAAIRGKLRRAAAAIRGKLRRDARNARRARRGDPEGK